MTKLRVGLIGVGRIADLHYEGYRDNPKVELTAICDVSKELLHKRKEQWGVKKTYLDYRELLQDENVDAVEVITPHHLHNEIGCAALDAKKHVSMQKPMAMNIPECDSLIAAAKRSGKMFRVFENFRHYPPLMKAFELLQDGAIGEPLTIRLKVMQGSMKQGWEIPEETVSWRFDPARSGGGRVIFDYGYHLFSVAMWLLGDVEKTHAYISYRSTKFGLLDSPAVVTWKYKDSEKLGSYEAVNSGDLLVPSKYWPEDEWFEVSGGAASYGSTAALPCCSTSHPWSCIATGSPQSIRTWTPIGQRASATEYTTSLILSCAESRHISRERRGGGCTVSARAIQRSARENREVNLDEIIEE